jgi:glutamate dehydrogenase/leucine dehydrogenase
MDLFGHLKNYDYGEVHFRFDKATGLEAIVAIHDSRLGPALGGCRFLEYESDETALVDALRLARGMTYKAALAGLAHGYDAEVSRAKTLKIYDTILDIAERSAKLSAPAYKVADIMVEEKLAAARAK